MKKSTIAAVIVALFAGNVNAADGFISTETPMYVFQEGKSAWANNLDSALKFIESGDFYKLKEMFETGAISRFDGTPIDLTTAGPLWKDDQRKEMASSILSKSENTLLSDVATKDYVSSVAVSKTVTDALSQKVTNLNNKVVADTLRIESKTDSALDQVATKASQESLEYLDGKVAEVEITANAAMSYASTALTTANTAKHNTEQLAINKADRSEIAGMNDDIRHNTSRINGLESKVADFGEQLKAQAEEIVANDKKAMAGIASAMAMSAMNYTNTTHSMAFATGKYDSGSAIGIGYKYQMGSAAQASIQATLDSNKNTGISAGVAFGW